MNTIDQDLGSPDAAEAPAEQVVAEASAEFEPAAPAAIWSMRLTALLLALLFASGPMIAVLVLVGAYSAWADYLVLGLIALLALRLAWRYAAARHRRFRFRLDGRGLEIHRGVIWHSEIRVLRSRVQHTDLSHGPLERRLGLASLLIHTAGTDNATIRLAGLAEARARAVRDALLEGHDERL
ncbi:PH domain-containing protein [Pseudomarimonas arenosa]|uniref:PH domain-containing protein n=1 Tax=Pseudomarimonas arenosa TaxID=2774145 RepID=A0AAW3ZSP3_9GAMM|nr:PH domain-containing protein [Pseudomarimonas arenosa]MBD8527482.1 PH domain-containing protein [Pseudomarimonas arenosa]